MKVVEDILQKEVSRKEFLTTVGLGVASIFGFSTILKLLGVGQHQQVTMGYGSSTYGGSAKKAT